jgi:predicted phosphodiesterase
MLRKLLNVFSPRASPGPPLGDVDLLFLDVDGVLNSRVSRDDGDHLPAPDMMAHLRYAVQQAHSCKIVLSSTWRLDAPLLEGLRHSLSEAGLSLHSATPTLEITHTGDRVDEIMLWLRSNHAEDLPWVAIDDIDLLAMNGKLSARNFVRTRDGTGLTRANAEEIVSKLQLQRTQSLEQPSIAGGRREDRAQVAVVDVSGAGVESPPSPPPSPPLAFTALPPPPLIPEAAKKHYDPTDAFNILRCSRTQRFDALPTPTAAGAPPKPEGAVRFVCISDTHGRTDGQHRPIDIPDGDVLVHCGDFTQTGKLGEVRAFCEWFGRLPHRRKLLIAGNHDLTLHGETYAQTGARFGHPEATSSARETCAEARRLIGAIPNCEYLFDSGTSVEGVSVWGSPWQPWFHDWAFNLERGEPCREKWRLIPTGTDVLLTHGPPMGHGDLTSSQQRAGCLDLLEEVQRRIRPQYHVFGHIHEGYGATTDGTTIFLNASTCTLQYRADNPPLVFDAHRRPSSVADGSGTGVGATGTA